MRRLWCAVFGHKLKRPRTNQGGSGVYTTCARCNAFFIRDYFSGWMPASKSERAHYLKTYGPKAAEPVTADPKE